MTPIADRRYGLWAAVFVASLLATGAVCGQVQFSAVDLSAAYGVSLDGSWVVGAAPTSACGTTRRGPARWSVGTGTQLLGPLNGNCEGRAWAVSADGSVVVGQTEASGPCPLRPFRWTTAGGMTDLGTLPGYSTASAFAVSVDGAVVVGTCGGSPEGACSNTSRGFVWTQASGMTAVPMFSASMATAISADGRFVAGVQTTSDGFILQTFVWDLTTPEPTGLGSLPGRPDGMIPTSVSIDGRMLVGGSSSGSGINAWIWSVEHGFRQLPSVPGTTLCRAYGADASGTMIVGRCNRPVFPFSVYPAVWTSPGPGGPFQVGTLSGFLGGASAPPTFQPDRSEIRGMTPDGQTIIGYTISTDPNAASAFKVDFCYPNCDRSTTTPYLNVADFTCFLQEFAAGQTLSPAAQLLHYANCDRSSAQPGLNVADFTCFLVRYAAGCP